MKSEPGSAGFQPASDPESGTTVGAVHDRPGSDALPLPGFEMVGKVLNEKYELLDLIGSGGMASVYRARDLSSGAIYALKLISLSVGDQQMLAKRLELEASAARALKHPGICAVYESGESDCGAPFLLMEYIEAQTLESVLNAEGSLDEFRAIDIFRQACSALQHAHEHNVVHRDLKPSNLLLKKKADGGDELKIVDFGIAKITGEDSEDKTKLTQTGELIGSPLYMSPEQCRGDQLDGRSDIYSFGCLMYEIFTGQPPFSGENPIRIIIKHLTVDPEPLPENLNSGLRSIVNRCLEKEATDRYHSAAELLADLDLVKEGKAIAPFKRKRRGKTPPILLSAALTVFIPLACFMLFKSLHSQLSDRPPLNLRHSRWDAADLSGLDFMNRGNYVEAETAFNQALALQDASDTERSSTLEKLAVIAQIKGQKKDEESFDARIKTLRVELASKNPAFDLPLLKEKIRQLENLDDDLEKKRLQKSLSMDLLFAAESFNANADPNSTNELFVAAFPVLSKQPDRSKEFYLLLAKQAEALMIAKSALMATRMLDENGSTASKYDEEALKFTLDSIAGLEKNIDPHNLELNRNYLRASEIYNNSFSADKAKEYCQKVLRYTNGIQTKEAQYLRMKASLQLARCLMILKDYPGAINEYRAILKSACKMKDAFEAEAIAEFAIEGEKNAYLQSGQNEGLEDLLLKQDESGKLQPLMRAANDMAISEIYFPKSDLSKGFQKSNDDLAPNSELQKAEPYLREALQIRQHLEQSLATEEVINSIQRLADLDHQLISKFARKELALEAEALARQNLAIFVRASQADSSSRKAYAYLDLAVALEANGKSKEADQYIEKFNQQLAATQGYALQDQQLKLEEKGNDKSLALAKAIFERGASCYGRGDLENARKLAERAAKLVLAFHPGELDPKARLQSAEILNTCSCLQEPGAQEALRYKKLQDQYRYFSASH